ncbi:hypothetical protein QTP88_004733 [Uroleucon formosanum]
MACLRTPMKKRYQRLLQIRLFKNNSKRQQAIRADFTSSPRAGRHQHLPTFISIFEDSLLFDPKTLTTAALYIYVIAVGSKSPRKLPPRTKYVGSVDLVLLHVTINDSIRANVHLQYTFSKTYLYNRRRPLVGDDNACGSCVA